MVRIEFRCATSVSFGMLAVKEESGSYLSISCVVMSVSWSTVLRHKPDCGVLRVSRSMRTSRLLQHEAKHDLSYIRYQMNSTHKPICKCVVLCSCLEHVTLGEQALLNHETELGMLP